MQQQTPPRDDDPSDMTDFEKNATNGPIDSGELGRDEETQLPPEPRLREERGNRGPEEEPGFGQGA